MAEAEQKDSGGDSGIDTLIIVFVLILLIASWLRGGGWHRLITRQINFGWQADASSTSPFAFGPNFGSLVPRVPIPTGPTGPQGPKGP